MSSADTDALSGGDGGHAQGDAGGNPDLAAMIGVIKEELGSQTDRLDKLSSQMEVTRRTNGCGVLSSRSEVNDLSSNNREAHL